MSFQHDIFISYSRTDRKWAEQLRADLARRGLDVFLDTNDIVKGAPWEGQVRTAAEQSRHVLALWSPAAQKSSWVSRELAYFDLRNNAPPAGSARLGQLMIFVLLDGDDPPYPSPQMITDLKGTYAAGFAKRDPAVWDRVVNDVVNAVNAGDKRTPVTLAVIAMTDAELGTVNPADQLPFAQPLKDLLPRIGLADVAGLTKWYGQEREHWRPFGGNQTVRAILDKIRDTLNQHLLEAQRFRWVSVDAAFWGADLDAASAAAARLVQGPSATVIDPLSLYHANVRQRLRLLQRCFQWRQSAILALCPFGLPAPLQHLRQQLRALAVPFFDPYYEPDIPLTLAATCAVNVSDEQEVTRLLRASLGQAVAAVAPAQPASFTSY
jgi:hypothetical protein